MNRSGINQNDLHRTDINQNDEADTTESNIEEIDPDSMNDAVTINEMESMDRSNNAQIN